MAILDAKTGCRHWQRGVESGARSSGPRRQDGMVTRASRPTTVAISSVLTTPSRATGLPHFACIISDAVIRRCSTGGAKDSTTNGNNSDPLMLRLPWNCRSALARCVRIQDCSKALRRNQTWRCKNIACQREMRKTVSSTRAKSAKRCSSRERVCSASPWKLPFPERRRNRFCSPQA